MPPTHRCARASWPPTPAARASRSTSSSCGRALPGRFNVRNALAAVVVARELGVDDATIADALPRAGRVPGRFEPVEEGQPFAVIVDYSHTPDSLENACARPARSPRAA